MTNLQVLEAARQVIATPGSWCQWYRDNHRGAHCALGALDMVLHNCCDDHPVVELLAATLTKKEKRQARGSRGASSYMGKAGFVAQFNNTSEHHEVLAFFDRAIERQAMQVAEDAPIATSEARMLVD